MLTRANGRTGWAYEHSVQQWYQTSAAGKHCEAIETPAMQPHGLPSWADSVFGRQGLKQMRHGLLIVSATYCFRQHTANVHCLDLVTLHLLHFMWYRVGNNNLSFIHQHVQLTVTLLPSLLPSLKGDMKPFFTKLMKCSFYLLTAI